MALEPSRTAVIEDGREVPWATLAAAVDAVDAELAARGLGPGTEVGVVLRNTADHLAAAVAVLASERCLVTVSPLFADAALVEDLQCLALPVVVATAVDWDRPGVDGAVRVAGCLGLELTGDATAPVKVRHIPRSAARAAGPAARSRAGRPRVDTIAGRPGVAVRMLTSGTTGAPKRVELT